MAKILEPKSTYQKAELYNSPVFSSNSDDLNLLDLIDDCSDGMYSYLVAQSIQE